ncbi:MAG: SGNH/GDSL hydrolase family protein [Bacilli bacterium]|nr:SGNH/GDSL hydrolase family protein [Bacilli bacterium]
MSKIVFMGDSITQYMPYIFKGNIGENGDEVKYIGVENIGIGTYMDYVWPRVESENADVYILLLGINNISRPDCDYDERQSLDDVADKLKEFIDKIVNSGAERLLVQSIYPTDLHNRKEKIIFVNNKIESYCNNVGIEYLDLHSILQDDEGLLDKKYSDDGIHPNELGYNVIADKINKRLKKGLGQKVIQKKK